MCAYIQGALAICIQLDFGLSPNECLDTFVI